MGIPVVDVLEHYIQQVKQLKEDNARWTCQWNGAEQKYLTQSNVIAELRERAEKAEKNAQELKEMFDRSYQRNVIANVKIGEHIAKAAAEKERADRVTEERARFNQVYEMLLKKFNAGEEREQKLKEAIHEAMSWTWGCGEENMTEVVGILTKVIDTLYPLDREDTTNEI